MSSATPASAASARPRRTRADDAEIFRHEYEQHIREHVACGLCGNLQLSPCENTCPLNMNIPGFLQC